MLNNKKLFKIVLLYFLTRFIPFDTVYDFLLINLKNVTIIIFVKLQQ